MNPKDSTVLPDENTARALIRGVLEESIDVKRKLLNAQYIDVIRDMAFRIASCLLGGGKVLVAGNGGSSADSAHFAAELLGKLNSDRRPLAAVDLTACVPALTAISNDYGFAEVFARQVNALADPGDVLLLISTSGRSENILAAAAAGKHRGTTVLALTGKTGGELVNLADITLVVPSDNTQRIQEAHITVLHAICQLVEEMLLRA